MSGRDGIRAVVVSHCSATTIEPCLRRLCACAQVARIIVVDNGSDDDTLARVQAMAAAEPRLHVQAHPDNPGFAAGCNAGALGGTEPWLAFVNPDCMVESDTFARMLDASADPQPLGGAAPPGVIGCVLGDAQGVEDAACRRRDPSLPAILRAGGDRTALHLAGNGAAWQPVDAVSGALMLVPRKVFDQVGGFDAGYRLHAEDLDLCRRVREAGFTVAIANAVRVVHLRGVSSRRRPAWVEWQKHRGLWRYFCKFEAARTPAPMRALLWTALWLHGLGAAVRAGWRARFSGNG